MEAKAKSRIISSFRLMGDTGLGCLAINAFNRNDYLTGTVLGVIAVKFALRDALELTDGSASLSYLGRGNPLYSNSA